VSKVPVIVFATMRRSGSHFCMHRALITIKMRNAIEFGSHVNSLGWGKMRTKSAAMNPAKVIAFRKQNHFYTDEMRASPRTGSDSPHYMQASYAWMLGRHGFFDDNPSGLRLRFLAINIEDETIDEVARKARGLLSAMPPFRETASELPIFVTLRSLRSIALSRKKWVEQNGDKNIMASGFKKLDTDVWADHYRSVINGQTKSGVKVVGLHYGSGVRTHGASIADAFFAAAGQHIDRIGPIPDWVKESVLSDGHGSSFVGSGASKAAEVRRSLDERASRLDEFSDLFEQCPEAKEHAERFGEL
jgi:hypothetical protein